MWIVVLKTEQVHGLQIKLGNNLINWNDFKWIFESSSFTYNSANNEYFCNEACMALSSFPIPANNVAGIGKTIGYFFTVEYPIDSEGFKNASVRKLRRDIL